MFTTNDTAPTLTGTCKSGSSPADLTGATLAVHIARPDKTVLTKTATAVSAVDGTWAAAAWATGDLTSKGVYKVEVEVTYASSLVQTFAGADFYVRPEIA